MFSLYPSTVLDIKRIEKAIWHETFYDDGLLPGEIALLERQYLLGLTPFIDLVEVSNRYKHSNFYENFVEMLFHKANFDYTLDERNCLKCELSGELTGDMTAEQLLLIEYCPILSKYFDPGLYDQGRIQRLMDGPNQDLWANIYDRVADNPEFSPTIATTF